MRQATTEQFNPAPSLTMDLLDAIQLPPRRSIDPITFSPSLSLPSPSSVAPMGLFSQPMDLPPLQTYASMNMNDFGVDGEFEKSAILEPQIGDGAGKSAWNMDDALPNVLIRTPTDQVRQMVPCTPGPATSGKSFMDAACGALDGQLGGYQVSEDESRDVVFDDGAMKEMTGIKGMEGMTGMKDERYLMGDAYLFGSSDEDAVSGEIRLNHVTGQMDVFGEGNSPAMIHSSSKLGKKGQGKVQSVASNARGVVKKEVKATKKSARMAASRAKKLEHAGQAGALMGGVGLVGGRSAAVTRSSGKTSDKANGVGLSKTVSKTGKAAGKHGGKAGARTPTGTGRVGKVKKTKMGEMNGLEENVLDVEELSSQDLRTPVASQQSQGEKPKRGSGKKPSRKTLAGRPVNTPITKKIARADKRSIIRRANLPWIFGSVLCPRTGVELREGDVPPAEFCTQCNATTTPVWRAGPFGHKTLCNACGVRWMKQLPSQRSK